MKIRLDHPSEIGVVIKSARKRQRLRQDDVAGIVGVSENFLGKVENGGETVQWGKLFQVLQGLGVEVWLDMPDTTIQTGGADSSRERSGK